MPPGAAFCPVHEAASHDDDDQHDEKGAAQEMLLRWWRSSFNPCCGHSASKEESRKADIIPPNPERERIASGGSHEDPALAGDRTGGRTLRLGRGARRNRSLRPLLGRPEEKRCRNELMPRKPATIIQKTAPGPPTPTCIWRRRGVAPGPGSSFGGGIPPPLDLVLEILSR